jgi:chemotaxis protein MotB
MRKWMGLLILCMLWIGVQACSSQFLYQGKKKITWERPPELAKEEEKTEKSKDVKKPKKQKALETLKNKYSKEIQDLQLKVEKLQNENMHLSQSVEAQQQDIFKKSHTITLQRNVIQLLDDPQNTIETGLRKQIESLDLSNSADLTKVKDVKFVFWDQLLFEPGQANITAKGSQLLVKLSKDLLNRYKACKIIVEGHTDNRPVGKKSPFESNWELSTARATAVVRFLQKKANIDPERLSATGYSQYRPATTNDTKEGRRQNRRIEIILSRIKVKGVSN